MEKCVYMSNRVIGYTGCHLAATFFLVLVCISKAKKDMLASVVFKNLLKFLADYRFWCLCKSHVKRDEELSKANVDIATYMY